MYPSSRKGLSCGLVMSEKKSYCLAGERTAEIKSIAEQTPFSSSNLAHSSTVRPSWNVILTVGIAVVVGVFLSNMFLPDEQAVSNVSKTSKMGNNAFFSYITSKHNFDNYTLFFPLLQVFI